MESGYTRKPRRKPRTKAQREARNEKRRALYAERHEQVPSKRGLGKKTIELLEKAKGKPPLAKESLEEAMLKTRALAQKHFPLDKKGNPRTRRNPDSGRREPVGNARTYLELAEASARFASWLAPYQSPKLAALAVEEAPSELTEETTFTINISNPKIQRPL
jgi:hypothetical protein